MMETLVILSLGHGDLNSGFPVVTAQLSEPGKSHAMKFTGGLPAAPDIAKLYRSWQLLYLALHRRLDLHSRIEVEEADVTNVSEVEFEELCQRLSNRMNIWLNSELFRTIDQSLRTHLNTLDKIRIVIETNDDLLQRLPWHLWRFLAAYPKTEIALSPSEYKPPLIEPPKTPGARFRILAVMGDAQGIDLETDQAYLTRLSGEAEIQFLVEPSLAVFHQQLWQGWDLLFFAGHSSSHGQGVLRLNPNERLTLEQLSYALKKAISRGLKLAIFNSCDGLGLARSLADLDIPQVIVMREPVPDQVAQVFLKHFLDAFSSGHSLYASVREAREKLQGLEALYPCASWLPVICQNPAVAPIAWKRKGDRPSKFCSLGTLLGVSIIAMASVMAVRYLGLLQPWELQAYDLLMRQRLDEGPDPRLLIVAITEEDFQLPEQAQRRGSLSDLALEQLLAKLEPLEPRTIGLDIFRDFPLEPDLAARLRDDPDFFIICKVSDRQANHRGVPPPREVPTERQGFSDVVKDPDNILRRHLLAMNPNPASPCRTSFALSARLAFHYLQTEGFSVQFTPAGELQIGDVTFNRLYTHQGAYQTVDTQGYQILLNYRASRSLDIAPSVTLKDVLSGQIQADAVKDRIVLLGVPASTAGDFLATPYSAGQGNYEAMAGVIAQAQMISQILSAVKDGRPLLTTWPLWGDLLWVWVWAGGGGVLAWHCRTPLLRVLSAGMGVGILYLLCLGLFTRGHWAPLVPSALALAATGGVVAVCPISPNNTADKRHSD